MTDAELALARSLRGADSLELNPNLDPSVSRGIGAALSQIMGNPPFKAEINVNISVKYYSQLVPGLPVEIAPAALQAAQKTQYPVYFFGQSDKASHYRKARQLLNTASWNEDDMAVIDGGNIQGAVIYPDPAAGGSILPYALGSVVNNRVLPGDVLLVIPQVGFVAAAAATTQICEVLIRCTNVGYGTLIDSLSSDLITLNMIRYTVDAAQTAQLQNQIEAIYQSLFGKASTDTIDPNAFITGGTYNPNIADIPLTIPIDKNLVLGTFANYDVVSFSWTLTVAKIQPLTNRPDRLSNGGAEGI